MSQYPRLKLCSFVAIKGQYLKRIKCDPLPLLGLFYFLLPFGELVGVGDWREVGGVFSEVDSAFVFFVARTEPMLLCGEGLELTVGQLSQYICM